MEHYKNNDNTSVLKKDPGELSHWQAPKIFSLKDEYIETGATPPAAENTGGLWSS